MKLGDIVERNTTELGYSGKKGTIIKIENGRAQVQWESNKTWYKLERLKISK